MSDYSTSTEHDAAISAGFDAYPDEPPMGRADLAREGEWWDGWEKRWASGEFNPHDWPREAEPEILAALRRAVDKTRGQQ